MPKNQIPTIAQYFEQLTDPRRDNRRHKLIDIITIAICAVICGAETWTDVELFGNERLDWLRQFLDLKNGFFI